jgi:hypothetical protein
LNNLFLSSTDVRLIVIISLVGPVASFNSAHEIANSIDLVGDDVAQLEARKPIFYRDYYFEAIKPVGSEIVAKAGLVRHAPGVDAEMTCYDFADLDVEVALHGRSSS